jgi:hypothetical protein
MHYRNILIPTNYTLTSVEAAAIAVQQIEGRFNVLFFHAFSIPVSSSEVVLPVNVANQHGLITERLRQKCKRIKQQNKQIGQIFFRPMYGSSIAIFRSYLLYNSIDFILLPPAYQHMPVLKESIDPQPLFDERIVPVVTATDTTIIHGNNANVKISEVAPTMQAT